METALPTEIPGYVMARSTVKPNQSYDAGARQYEFLAPYGIVCRVFNKGDISIDTVAIAGNDRDTFHDPFFCLPGQDWKITSSRETTIETETRGTLPATMIRLRSPQGSDHTAIFLYKGPTKFHPTQNSLYLDWFSCELQMKKPSEGAFYRFMGMSGPVRDEDVFEVAREYLDQAAELSGSTL